MVQGIDVKTLKKHYADELATGATRANAKVAMKLFQLASSGNVTAQIFWLKNRAGWRDKVEVDDRREVDPEELKRKLDRIFAAHAARSGQESDTKAE